jgi:hypothetical protein
MLTEVQLGLLTLSEETSDLVMAELFDKIMIVWYALHRQAGPSPRTEKRYQRVMPRTNSLMV